MTMNNTRTRIAQISATLVLTFLAPYLVADPAKVKPAISTAPVLPDPTASAETTKWNPDQLKIKEYLEDLFKASRDVNAGGDAQKKARAKIESAMNWERIAIDCLGAKQWAAQPVKNRNQFRDLLHEVIAKTAFTRLDAFWNGASYTFNKIDVKGKEAHVVAVYKVKGDALSLEYYLERSGASWRLYDISYEGFRYSSNINEQLKEFLKEKGFASLIDRLKKRLDDLNKGKKA